MDDHHFHVSNKKAPGQAGELPTTPERNSKQKPPRPTGQVDIIALVRSLQRRAGATDCFRKGNADCDDVDCQWRPYCLSGTASETDRPKRASEKDDP